MPKSPQSKFSSRQMMQCPIFGTPKDFSRTLPTHEDVIKCCAHERWRIGCETGGNKEPCFSVIAENVALKVENLYTDASIPSVSHKRVCDMIHAYHGKYRLIMKNIKRVEKSKTTLEKVEKFKMEAKKLFDISACKCTIFKECICPKEIKVPLKEQAFLIDQRTERKMSIGIVDIIETKRLQKRQIRKEKDAIRSASKQASPASTSSHSLDHEGENEKEGVMDIEWVEDETNTKHTSYNTASLKQPTKSSQMRLRLDNTVLVSERYGVSSRATAAIASSVMQDLGLISESDASLVTDKNKICREKSRIYKKILAKSNENRSAVCGLYFDGRHDKTLTLKTLEDKQFQRTVVEAHYCIVSEPDSTYVGHVTPESGSSLDIANSIYEYVTSTLLDDFSNVIVLGCDGTVVNTGVSNGVIRRLELKLQRPLQWIICLLHFNELPLRHLFESIDGKSSGPTSYTGLIGQNLKGCEKLPIVAFTSIECELPDIDSTILSSDQKYLLDICAVISSGVCCSNLANRER